MAFSAEENGRKKFFEKTSLHVSNHFGRTKHRAKLKTIGKSLKCHMRDFQAELQFSNFKKIVLCGFSAAHSCYEQIGTMVKNYSKKSHFF